MRTAVVAFSLGAAAAAFCSWREGLTLLKMEESRAAIADLGTLGRSKRVALTFDDGPDPRYTPAVLQILERKAVRATFFVVGRQVRAHRELALKTYLGGHELANHTWSHHVLTDLSWVQTVRELTRTQDELLSLTGLRTRYFRPPKGRYDEDDIKAARAMGYRIVMWTVCVENRFATTPRVMVDRVLSRLSGEAVILLHDGRADRSKTVAALPLLVDALRSRGYSFVTVSEMLSRSKTAELVD